MLKNFRWTGALIGVIIGLIVILAGGIPLAINHGVIAFLSFSGVVAALLAVYIATRSLQLTRDTQRPFLNIDHIGIVWSHGDNNKGNVNYFVASINNTGIFPADKIQIDFEIWLEEKDSSKRSLKVRDNIPLIIFPVAEASNIILEEDTEHKLVIGKEDKLLFQMRIKYFNKLSERTHNTIRNYLTSYIPGVSEQPIPNPKDDFWD